jgi:hypothetical protein
MSYIGRDIRTGAFRQLDDISSGFDGSDTTHTMQVNSTNVSVGDVNQILLSLGGVIQKPGTDFTVSGSTLTFTTAPAANTSFFAILLGSDNGGTVTPTDGSVTTGKIVDDAVTAAKVASSGAFAIGAAGTASSLAGIPFYNGDTTSIYTHDVSGTDSSATDNTAFGKNALDAITSATDNVAVGHDAGTAVTTGGFSVFVGADAGKAQTTGNTNVGIGYQALTANVDGDRNTAVGTLAFAALDPSSNADMENVAVGYYAGAANTTGDYNTFLGALAGTSVTTGSQNILIGRYAGGGFDTENHNLAIGRNALGGSVAGGEYNVAVGNYTLDALTSADNVIGIGYNAGSAVTTASDSIFIGSNAGNATTTSTQNTFIGSNAGYGSTGDGNTTVGSYTMYDSTSSNKNSCLGQYAGYNITSGDNNLLLGYNAGRSTAPSGLITTGSNNVCLGDNNISDFFCADTSISSSDKRDKTDIENFNVGLEWIEKLQPVTYRWDRRTWYGDENNAFGTPDGSKKRDRLHLGFLAQDVLEVEKSFGYAEKRDDMLTVNLTEDGMSYGMKYERLVTVLVNAVKELSTKVKALEEA